MDTRDPYLAQDQLSPRQIEPAEALEDRRWPGVFMVLLILLGLVWPLGGMVAALVAYLTADREQGGGPLRRRCRRPAALPAERMRAHPAPC